MNINQQMKIQAMYRAGTFAKAALSPDLTREGIDAMDKETLIGLLEAHGVTADKRKGAATLAEELKTVVFFNVPYQDDLP